MTNAERLQLGVSACLLGEAVRYDGRHKRNAYLVETLGRFFDVVPICPEVAIGLGVPRPPIRLVGEPESPRLVRVDDPSIDLTAPMEAFSAREVQRLGGISGFVLKARSPSCGPEGVPVQADRRRRAGSGLFARALTTAFPLLPVVQEEQLNDPKRRDNFLERVFAYRRWQELNSTGLTPARLLDFHARHKLSLLAHGAEGYRTSGRLLADMGSLPLEALGRRYFEVFMKTLQRQATVKRHANVLQHISGYLKRKLEACEKAELQEMIEAYRREELPLLMPITLLRHHFRHHPDPYIAKQTYLYPSREELLLRFGGW